MNLAIHNHLFIVGGATSGFGKAIAVALINEGASVIAIARDEEKLKQLKATASSQIEILPGDLSNPLLMPQLVKIVGERQVHGILVNAGGPPAKTVLETSLEDWDNAYQLLLRWKVAITQTFIPEMIAKGYGRLVFIESVSVKQPIENLVLSTSLRLGVVGMVKTLSQEIAKSGVTLNVLAPGSHDTPAVDRLYHKKAEQTGMPFNTIKEAAINNIPVGSLGDPNDFAGLALWLLSPASKFVTGQTITVDGGSVRGIMG